MSILLLILQELEIVLDLAYWVDCQNDWIGKIQQRWEMLLHHLLSHRKVASIIISRRKMYYRDSKIRMIKPLCFKLLLYIQMDFKEGMYKVKDLSLAEWGRKEIELAEAEMPGLMSLRKEF